MMNWFLLVTIISCSWHSFTKSDISEQQDQMLTNKDSWSWWSLTGGVNEAVFSLIGSIPPAGRRLIDFSGSAPIDPSSQPRLSPN